MKLLLILSFLFVSVTGYAQVYPKATKSLDTLLVDGAGAVMVHCQEDNKPRLNINSTDSKGYQYTIFVPIYAVPPKDAVILMQIKRGEKIVVTDFTVKYKGVTYLRILKKCDR